MKMINNDDNDGNDIQNGEKQKCKSQTRNMNKITMLRMMTVQKQTNMMRK